MVFVTVFIEEIKRGSGHLFGLVGGIGVTRQFIEVIVGVAIFSTQIVDVTINITGTINITALLL